MSLVFVDGYDVYQEDGPRPSNREDSEKHQEFEERVNRTVKLTIEKLDFIDTGYIHRPYVPLSQTNVVLDPDTFVPRKGLLTRYGKKILEDGGRWYQSYLPLSSAPAIKFEEIEKKRYLIKNEPEVSENVWQESEERESVHEIGVETAAKKVEMPLRYKIPYQEDTISSKAIRRKEVASEEIYGIPYDQARNIAFRMSFYS